MQHHKHKIMIAISLWGLDVDTMFNNKKATTTIAIIICTVLSQFILFMSLTCTPWPHSLLLFTPSPYLITHAVYHLLINYFDAFRNSQFVSKNRNFMLFCCIRFGLLCFAFGMPSVHHTKI